MEKFEIKEPIWLSKSVGLSCERIDVLPEGTWVGVEILYTDSKGKRMYPGLYTICVDKIKNRKVQTLSSGRELYIVPIADMTNENTREKMRKEHIDNVLNNAGKEAPKEDPVLKDMDKAYYINDQIKERLKEALNSYIDKPLRKILVMENLESLLGQMTPDIKYDIKVEIDEKDPRNLNVAIIPILDYVRVSFSYEVPSVIDKLADDIHKYACEKGFWECPICHGIGSWNKQEDDINKIMVNSDQVQICPMCKGTGKWRNDGECIALMHSELSEALESLRAGEPAMLPLKEPTDKPEGWATELADCMIRILDFVASKGIKNFNKIIEDKMKFNKTRPWKHNKKF
jgi:NTP pyrophosphatase (non-canonical NTP hydrolase)